MTSFDVEIARIVYVICALGIVLFTSMLFRWLWRPLRFLLLAAVISVFFTPYFVDQDMPDGKKQNIVPAFVVMLYDGANNRDNWQQAIKKAGGAIAVVGAVLGTFSLVLAMALPKAHKKAKPENDEAAKKQNSKHKNPYLPDDFQAQT